MASDKESETLDETAAKARPQERRTPGLVALWCGDRPVAVPCAASKRGEVLGRGWLAEVGLADERASREHCRLWLDGGGLVITALTEGWFEVLEPSDARRYANTLKRAPGASP